MSKKIPIFYTVARGKTIIRLPSIFAALREVINYFISRRAYRCNSSYAIIGHFSLGKIPLLRYMRVQSARAIKNTEPTAIPKSDERFVFYFVWQICLFSIFPRFCECSVHSHNFLCKLLPQTSCMLIFVILSIVSFADTHVHNTSIIHKIATIRISQMYIWKRKKEIKVISK